MKYYFLLFLIDLFISGSTINVDSKLIYVDSKILDVGFEVVSSSDVEVNGGSSEISKEQTAFVFEKQVGKLSRYGPDCYGCSGYLAHGDYVGDGTVYYNDLEYGQVRILAADRQYPFGTIVRVRTDEKIFLAIVLDRGGAIGFGKVALFDLLYPSEYLANIDGVSHNTSFEVLRYGF